MKGTKVFPSLLLIFTFLSACHNSAKDFLPGISLPIENMNTSFVIVDDPVIGNSHKNGEILTLVIRNLTDKTIVFPNDYNLNLFVFQNQSWIPIQNRFLYTGNNQLLPPSKVFPLGMVAVAYPYIPNLVKSIDVRIVMIGHYENSNAEEVGAYLDLILQP